MNYKYIIIVAAIVLAVAGSFYFFINNSNLDSKAPVKELPLSTASEQIIVAENIPRLSTGVYREMPTFVYLGSEVEVFLNVTIGDSKYYVIEEKIPENWTIIDAGGASVDSQNNIKWVMIGDAKDVVLKYKISSKSKGVYTFSGKFAIGSTEEFFIIGKTQIQVN